MPPRSSPNADTDIAEVFLRELTLPLKRIGVTPALAGKLSRLGITTLASLLCHYPRDWEDWNRKVPLKDWSKDRICTTITVLAHDWFGFGRMRTLKIYVEDETAKACLVCFNRPFLGKQLLVGSQHRLFGQFSYKYGDIQSSTFKIEPLATASDSEGCPLLPVYPLTEGLTQAALRKLMHKALDSVTGKGKDANVILLDELPQSLIRRDTLLSKREALRAIHFPSSLDELAQAKKTLIYEELFYLEVMMGQRAVQRKSAAPAPLKSRADATGDFSPLQLRLLERLTFSLTSGQKDAVREINQDMDKPFPMARLLQGDVGSGKTLVAFLAALRAVEGGAQAALLAPTELLARQHAENAALLLEPLGVRIAFLTGNLKNSGRMQLLKALASGEIDIVAGTHALFSRDVEYQNLSLVIVDEQHRFGVIQRQAIMAKGSTPHLLMMSATPIPRSLALTVFGDLDVSIIRGMPIGRKPIKTHLAKKSNDGKVYDFVRRELEAGHQAYFVYPLIEGGDESNLKDAVSMAEHLAKEVFPAFPLALLHSKVDDDQKRLTMDAFKCGEVKILVATSVVEVGVDVPNASCMVIEHAERFGLSALHQLRGRVGRSSLQSYCFLIYADSLTEDGKIRLKVMLEHSDGFVIAEEDFKLRGAGQMAGIEQSGRFTLGLSDPIEHTEELNRARADAFAMLEHDPNLEHEEHRCVAEVLKRAAPFSDINL